jgi:hypothetical protein
MNNIEIPIIFVKMFGALYQLSCTIASTLKKFALVGARTQQPLVIFDYFLSLYHRATTAPLC